MVIVQERLLKMNVEYVVVRALFMSVDVKNFQVLER